MTVDQPGSFEETGMRVLRAVVEPELCEKVRRTVEPWARRHSEPGSRYQDAWMGHRPVRELARHPRIMAELWDLYGRRPVPFQTLQFPRGTQQPLHADSIHFDSIPPGWMCGVWVALEDVGAEQGPLVVVPGSHGVTREVFEAGFAHGPGFDMGTYEQNLTRRLADMPTEEFHAHAGDVLIWHSDLAHGGAPLVDPAATRWSQVTHYFFDGFTYVTPLRGDAASGEVHLREPLIDIATRRAVSHRVDGRRANLVRLANGRTRLSGPPQRELTWKLRTASFARGVQRRVGSRVWLSRGLVPLDLPWMGRR